MPLLVSEPLWEAIALKDCNARSEDGCFMFPCGLAISNEMGLLSGLTTYSGILQAAHQRHHQKCRLDGKRWWPTETVSYGSVTTSCGHEGAD